MKNIFFLIMTLLICKEAFAVDVTLHLRSDSHTVNGLNAEKLLDEQSSSSTSFTTTGQTVGEGQGPDRTFQTDIYIRHADGTETEIDTSIASVSRLAPGPASGIQTNTYSFPETTLVATDAIKIVETMTGAGSATNTWISERLGWVKIKASTWTFHKYTELSADNVLEPFIPIIENTGYFHFGDSSTDSKITGIDAVLAGGYSDIQ